MAYAYFTITFLIMKDYAVFHSNLHFSPLPQIRLFICKSQHMQQQPFFPEYDTFPISVHLKCNPKKFFLAHMMFLAEHCNITHATHHVGNWVKMLFADLFTGMK